MPLYCFKSSMCVLPRLELNASISMLTSVKERREIIVRPRLQPWLSTNTTYASGGDAGGCNKCQNVSRLVF